MAQFIGSTRSCIPVEAERLFGRVLACLCVCGVDMARSQIRREMPWKQFAVPEESHTTVLYLSLVSPCVAPVDRPSFHEHNYPLLLLSSSYVQQIRSVAL